jgi:hypothetical protein
MAKHPQAQSVRSMRMDELRNKDKVIKDLSIEIFGDIIKEFRRRPLVTEFIVEESSGRISIGGKVTEKTFSPKIMLCLLDMFNEENGYYAFILPGHLGIVCGIELDPDMESYDLA